jgi:hypothetical protein
MKDSPRTPHQHIKKHLVCEIEVRPLDLVTRKFGPYKRGTPAPRFEIHVRGESPPTSVAYSWAEIESMRGDTYRVVYWFHNFGNVTARVEIFSNANEV